MDDATVTYPHLGRPTLAEQIRAILTEHGLVTIDQLDDAVRRIMLAVNERNRSGGW